MKNTLLTLAAACALTGCAGVNVSHTDIATGATKPTAIYIRSYADEAQFIGHQGDGEKPIRHSLAPANYSKALKEQLEKIAPAMVLADDETPTTGWLVESNLEVVDAGNPNARRLLAPGAGQSHIKIHVRVIDVKGKNRRGNVSDMGKSGVSASNVLYEFDLEGGSNMTGPIGSIYAPGWGYAPTFDYKNAAERVYMALSVDPMDYGTRQSPTIR
jgi:hypothetical protein